MKITRRIPRIKIGNTTYTFGKNGINRSTNIAKGVHLRTSANGKQSIGGGFLFWRWSQDLDELDGKKTTQEIRQIREQRRTELSLGLLLMHPLVFFDHFLRKNRTGQAVQNTASLQSVPKTVYMTRVIIFKLNGSSFTKVTEGTATLADNKIVVAANVTKEILFSDISDVYCDQGKLFVVSRGRNIPLVLEMPNVQAFMAELHNLMGDNC